MVWIKMNKHKRISSCKHKRMRKTTAGAVDDMMMRLRMCVMYLLRCDAIQKFSKMEYWLLMPDHFQSNAHVSFRSTNEW